MVNQIALVKPGFSYSEYRQPFNRSNKANGQETDASLHVSPHVCHSLLAKQGEDLRA